MSPETYAGIVGVVVGAILGALLSWWARKR